MFGFYENFPETIHYIARFSFSTSNKRLQQTLIHALLTINNKPFPIETITGPSIPQCTASIEFGIADTNSFNYLNDEETEKILKIIRQQNLQILDFFCAIRYYKTQKETRTPLKFDYHLLRLVFDEKSMEIKVFHERGPRHVTPKDVIDFVVNKINDESQRKILRPVESF